MTISLGTSVTAEDNETFFKEGLAKLRAGDMQESTGKLIMDLMEVRADNALLPFARKWIKEFPRVESAPRLVGKWLQKYESNDAMYMATDYVKTYPDVNALIFILGALAQLSKTPQKLFDAVEKRFAAEPNSYVWRKLQGNQNPKEELDTLILRWLEINRYNPNLAVDVSFVALFSTSGDVLNEVFRWIEVNQDKSPDVWIVFMNMLRGNSAVHEEMRFRVATTASQYFKRNPDDRNAGRLAYEILLVQQVTEQIQATKGWVLMHRDSDSTQMALAGIFHASHMLGDTIEPEYVQLAKSILTAGKPEESSPLLAIELFKETKDSDSLRLAKEVWRYHKYFAWLHADLLRMAPDEELISMANEICSTRKNVSPKIIVELLKLDRQNAVAKKAAQRWVKENPDEPQVKELQALLNS